MAVTRAEQERGPTSLMEEARLRGEYCDWHNLLYDVAWLTGPLDPAAVRDAWWQVCRRHDVMRRTYVSPEEACTHREVVSELELRSAATDAEAIDTMRRSLGVPFDLSGPTFGRVVVVRRSEQRHLLGIAVDHIISDQMSWRLLCRDFVELYARRLAGDTDDAEQATYRSFALQMRRDFAGAWGRERREFWRSYTSEFGLFPPPFAIHEESASEPVMAVAEHKLPAGARAHVLARAQQARATPFAVTAAGVLGAMRKLSGDDIVGLTFNYHGRNTAGSLATLGLFTQTVPLHFHGIHGSPLDTVGDVFRRSLEVADHILPLRVAGHAWSEELMKDDAAAGVFLTMTEGGRPSNLTLAGTSAEPVEMNFDGAGLAADTIAITWELHETGPQVIAVYNENAFSAASVEKVLDDAVAIIGCGGTDV